MKKEQLRKKVALVPDKFSLSEKEVVVAEVVDSP